MPCIMVEMKTAQLLILLLGPCSVFRLISWSVCWWVAA